MGLALDMNLEALIFDLDGVLTDTAECHYLAWQRLADELSIPFDRERNQLLRGIGRLESLEIILEKSERAFTSSEKSELAARKNDYYKSLILEITPQEILPGMRDLLGQLRGRGIKAALASASANAPAILTRLGITHLLDYVVDPTMLKAGKPAPDIFIEAARGLGVNVRNCIGIEDAHAGIQSIKSAGMFAVGIGRHLADAPCDMLLDDTTHISLEALIETFRHVA